MIKKIYLLPMLLLFACNGNNGNVNNNTTASDTDMSAKTEVISDTSGTSTITNEIIDPEGNNTDTDSAVKKARNEDSFIDFYQTFIADLKNAPTQNLKKYVHPLLGMIIVYRPGAIDRIDVANNFDEVFSKLKDYNAKQRLAAINCNPVYGKMPESPCNGEQKQGCTVVEVKNYTRLSEMVKAFEQYDFKDNATPEARKKIGQIENKIEIHTANFSDGMALDFMKGSDGKWYVVVIDLARYSCSA